MYWYRFTLLIKKVFFFSNTIWQPYIMMYGDDGLCGWLGPKCEHALLFWWFDWPDGAIELVFCVFYIRHTNRGYFQFQVARIDVILGLGLGRVRHDSTKKEPILYVAAVRVNHNAMDAVVWFISEQSLVSTLFCDDDDIHMYICTMLRGVALCVCTSIYIYIYS